MSNQVRAILVCDREFAIRLGARDVPTLLREFDGLVIFSRVGEDLIWPFVPDDVKDLNRRMTA